MLTKTETLITPDMIKRPSFIEIPLAEGLAWGDEPTFIFEEKMDGIWSVQKHGGAILCGEKMRNGDFYAFDLVALDGQDLRGENLRQRLTLLDDYARRQSTPILRPARGNGGAFLHQVLARGGEGVVAKRLDSRFGDYWHKCKKVETFDLVITEKHPVKATIRLSTLDTAEDVGWCPCRAAYDRLTVGDIVEIAAFSRTANGKLREPRFLRRRTDKGTIRNP